MTTAPQILSVDRVESDEGRFVSLKIRVPRELKYFEGHFPETALLPGVVQIAWAVELAKSHLGLTRRIAGMSALKFSRPILPMTRLDLTLQLPSHGEQLRFRYSALDEDCSSGTLLLA